MKEENMTTLEIPMNKYLGIYKIRDDEFLLAMEADEKLQNHVGTLHATALFGLAEASSGEFLLEEFSEMIAEVIPVVRKAEIKFSKPSSGRVKSKAMFFESEKVDVLYQLETSKRALVKVKVDIYNEAGQNVLYSIFQWFVVRNN